ASASAGPPLNRPPQRLSEGEDSSATGGSVVGEVAGAQVHGVAELLVARGRELGGQAEELDEAAGVRLVEAVALVVGGEVEVVQAGLAAAAGHGGAAAVQAEADVAAHVLLGVLDEGVEGVLQRGEPLALVDRVRPAVGDGALEA